MITFRMWAGEHGRWTQQAADRFVGQLPMFEGRPAIITAATIDDDDPAYIHITLEPR